MALKRIVFTGGPCGGKTSMIEILQRDFGEKLAVVPEAATILYSGGFPRLDSPEGRRAVQRTVYRVQHELEELVAHTPNAKIILCDRGTMDGPAYWPGTAASFWKSVGTTVKKEAARYDIVFHLRAPPGSVYQLAGTRNETPEQAMQVDARIEAAWKPHPKRYIIENTGSFMKKVADVRAILAWELPDIFRK